MFKLVLFLEAMVKTAGVGEVAGKVRQAISFQARDRGLNFDPYLDEVGLRALYKKAIIGDSIDVFSLADLIRRLRVPLEMLVDVRPAPWDDWRPGSTVAVVTGMQRFEVPHGVQKKGIPRWAVDERDLQGQEQLINWLGNDLGLSYRWERSSVACDLTGEAARAKLDELCQRPDVGAIVVLCSPVVNPVADEVARRILDDLPADKLPARFRWGFPLITKDPYLSEPFPCRRDEKDNEEGIRFRGHGRTTLPRVNNADAFDAVRRGGRGPFRDCGLLLIDGRQRPRLILCSGHGGCGTLACTYALTEAAQIDRLLRRLGSLWPEGEGRVFAPVWVKRTKPTADEIDDFVFDKKRGKGWGFWGEDPE